MKIFKRMLPNFFLLTLMRLVSLEAEFDCAFAPKIFLDRIRIF